METIFESLEPTIVPLVEYGLKSDPVQAVSMMTSVEFQLEKWKDSDQEFNFAFFDSLMLRIRRAFKQFVVRMGGANMSLMEGVHAHSLLCLVGPNQDRR
jgi:hypothetical protein